MPAVSVIIPTYNREKWLPVSVGSVRAQTFGDWELLVIDDRSTDASRQLLERYASEDPRIRCFPNQRVRGPAGARNQGIELARGRYVAFLDSDDEWEPCHLETMVGYLDRYPDQIELMTANAIRKIRETGEVYQNTELDLGRLDYSRLDEACVFNPDTLFDKTMEGSMITTQTMVMKREVLDRVKFDEEMPPGPEDIFFHQELAYRKTKVAHLQKFHVIYWAHGGNLTAAGGLGDARQKIDLFLAYEQMTLKILRVFELTPRQRAGLRDWLARLYFWRLGYSAYLEAGEYAKAREYFRRAIRIQPINFRFWKSYLASYARQMMGTARPSRKTSVAAAAAETK